MGDSRPDNGGGWPPEDGGGGLPELPPEWGTVVIPDDPAELDEEAHVVRRELRRDARRYWLAALVRLRPMRLREARLLSGKSKHEHGEPSVGVPLMIMSVAVLTTLISLFVVTWGRPTTAPEADHRLPATAANPAPVNLINLVLRDETGAPVRLGTLLPAVVLLIDGCRCPGLVLDVGAAVPTGLRVVAVGTDAPVVPDRPDNVTSLADPEAKLGHQYAKRGATTGATATTSGAATAILVDHRGDVISVTSATRADDLPPIDMTILRDHD